MYKEKLIIAVDFDGCICQHMYPDIGREMPGAFSTLKKFIAAGDRLILWTCRMPGHGLEAAIEWCKDNGVEFEEHNNNVQDHDYAKSRKIYADLYIDDRVVGGFPGWDVIEKEVSKLRESLCETKTKEPIDKLSNAIQKINADNKRWKLFVSDSSEQDDTSLQLFQSRSTSSAILEATKIIEENNLWHYGSAVLIADSGYKYDLDMNRMRKLSDKLFCYCGRAIDESNLDAITYNVCNKHLQEI